MLDADQRSALAVTRSLGKQHIPVVTASEYPTALAACSRFSAAHHTYPPPGSEQDAFTSAVIDIVRDQSIDVLMPMTELTCSLLLRHAGAFPGIVLPFAEHATIESLNDKCRLMRLAESLQVPIPRTWYVENADRLPCKLDELTYPLVLKPGHSWLALDGKWTRTAVQIAADPDAASQLIATNPALRSHPFMLQSFIPGHGQGIFALYDRGTPLAMFAHRRLREKPPRGGVSVLSESIKTDPVLARHARSILDNVNWHGVAMVEYKITPEGEPYLMEINTRFWGSLQLAIDAGLDFPYLLYQLACGEHPEPASEYRSGTRLRWLLGDLDNLYLTWRDPHLPARHKLLALLHFLAPSRATTRYETARWEDLGPFRCELGNYLRDLFR